MVKITCSHRSNPMCFITMTDHQCKWLVGMTGHSLHMSITHGCFNMKRKRKTQGEYTTFQKWQCDLDRENQTMSLFNCNTEKQGAKRWYTTLKCKVCMHQVHQQHQKLEKVQQAMVTVVCIIQFNVKKKFNSRNLS